MKFNPVVRSIFLSAALILGLSDAHARDRDLRVYNEMFCWNRSPQTLVGAEYPGALHDPRITAPFPKASLDYPESGAKMLIIDCQRPGDRFFTPDGKSTPREKAELLARQVKAIRYFSGTPLVRLFDPDPSCRLESEQAYIEAARWVIQALEEELGFILCISDQCDDPRWEEGPNAIEDYGIVERIAGAIQDASPGRIAAAGGDSPDILEDLRDNAPSVGALVRRSDSFEYGRGTLAFGPKPIIEIVDSAKATEEAIVKAWALAEEDARYAFALSTSSPSPDKAMLELLRTATNRYQIEKSSAVPPDPNDEFSLKEGEKEEGFLSLFNGKNLDGWVANTKEANFVVREDYIAVAEKSGGWLRSYHPYDDFIFRCEYQIAEGENSGIHVRAPLTARNSRVGFEYQILGEPLDRSPHRSGNGSIYEVRPPDEIRMKPYGEWNEVEIACKGPRVRIVWNGGLVHDVDYHDFENMAHRKQKGYFGLQDHQGSVKFRNIRIKPLGPEDPLPN